MNAETISNAIENFDDLTQKEIDVLSEYLNQKDIDEMPLSADEEHLMSLIPAFQPDPDQLVLLGDYVNEKELAAAEFGYDIYDKKKMLVSVKRRLDAGDSIHAHESDRIFRIWSLNANDKTCIYEQLALITEEKEPISEESFDE